ncbi:MAG: ribokinase [Bacillota bacterium]
MKPDIVVLGSLNVDFVVRTSRRPAAGETVLGKSFQVHPGGKGANQAVAAAKAGRGKVALVGKVGNDPFSATLLDSLSKAGVCLDLVERTSDAPTGTAFITVDDHGENSIIVVPGANALCSRKDVDAARLLLREAKILLVQLEIPFDTVVYAVQVAREMGVTILLDPAPARPLPAELLSTVDIITPNEHEASVLTGREVVDIQSARVAAADLTSRGVRCAVVKLGARGVVLSQNNTLDHIPGFEVPATDTTAAGDAFAGGLAAALVEGRSLGEACFFANAVAALSVTKPGAQSSMPCREEVEEFIFKGG